MKPPQIGGYVISKLGGKRELIPWVGTDPDRPANIFGVDISPPFDIDNPTWACDKRFFWSGSNHCCQKGPTHMGQFRPPGSKAEKSTQDACTTFLGTVFEGFSPSDGRTMTPMTLFWDTLRDHFIKNGMFDTMLFLDPILKKKQLDLFKNHGRFTLDHIREQTALRLKTADCYTQNNMIWGGVCLRASFSADILAKVTALVGVQAHGPATHLAFIAAMKMGASFEGLEKTKNELFALSLKDIPGENVPEINLKIMEHVNQLECSGEFCPEHIPKIVSICESCTEERFLQWICGIHDLANDHAEKLLSLRC